MNPLWLIATEEEVPEHRRKRLGQDEAPRERAVCLPHFQVHDMASYIVIKIPDQLQQSG